MHTHILIVQFRTDASREHEQKCFRETLSDYSVELRFVNAVTHALDSSLLNNVDAVILGGSGEFHLTNGDGNDTWMPKTMAFIDQLYALGIPTLGICFGMQLLGLYEGSDIVADESMVEVGGYEATLTEVGKGDPLFSHITDSFMANFAHKDTNVNFPDSVVVLASSERVACEAFRVKNRDVWAVMFHAEMTQLHMMERLYLYVENGRGEYAENGGVETTAARFIKTGEADRVLPQFVAYVCKGQ